MSKEITDVELQWAIEKIGERDKQISGLISKNIALREELQANISLRNHFAGLAMQGFISLNKFNTDMSVQLLTTWQTQCWQRGRKKDD